MLPKNTTQESKSLEAQLAESQATFKKQRDLDQQEYANALQECQVHREQELESLNDRLGLEHLKQRADFAPTARTRSK